MMPSSTPSPSSSSSSAMSSTALQRVPTAKEAKEGCLQIKPLSIVPTNSETTNEDEFLSLPNSKSATVTMSVSGQTRSSKLPATEPVIVATPLSHLYHSQLHVQVEFPSSGTTKNGKITYRGSFPVDEMAIHRTSIISINLQRKDGGTIVVRPPSSSSSSSSAPTTTTPTPTAAGAGAANIALKVECKLQGPCRSEIIKAHQALGAWLTVIDKVEDVIKEVWNKISPSIPNAAKKKEALLLLIPAVFSIMVPLMTACVIVSPLVIGFCILFFPIMIPLVVGISLFVLAAILGTCAIFTGIFYSSRYGRNQLQNWWQSQTTLQDYWNVLRGPRFGLQTFYYATGPRPTPVTLTRTQMPREKWRRLGVSLTIDGVGSFSYLLPFLGEAFDVVWAPAQTVLIMALYQHVSPNMSYVSFAEEMLPFLDVLPSATTGWLMEFGPEILEDAKGLVENPKQLQMILWGTNDTASGSASTTPLQPNTPVNTPRNNTTATSAGSRRPLPTGRPSRH